MRREGDVCRPDSLVRPVPLPEHLPASEEPIIEDVTENERDKETVAEEQKEDSQGEQDTGTLVKENGAFRLPKLKMTLVNFFGINKLHDFIFNVFDDIMMVPKYRKNMYK